MTGIQNIAVTGASGFIGRHVLAELSKHSVQVTAVSRSKTRLEPVPPGTSIVELDIASPGPDCFERLGRPDVLIHLAWDGLPNYKSLHHVEVELPRQYEFLKVMIEAGLPALLVTGTCFEYGMQSGPLVEDLEPRPCNAYGVAKNNLRRQLEFLAREFPIAMTWARLFYSYGNGQPATSLYPQLKAAVSRGDKIFDMSGGEQLRDYLPVAEVARLVVELTMLRKHSGTVNICSGQPVSVRRLVEGWIKESTSDIQLNLGRYPYPDYEPLAFWGVRSKLDSLLDQV